LEEGLPSNDIIVIGASAGGVQALSEVVASLPADLPAAVFAVLHLTPFGRSALPQILNRSSHLVARHPEDGEEIRPGHVYVAPPDRHLALDHGRVLLGRGPTENGHRPAVDVLFRTAARAYGPRVVGVVMTGNLDDGTAGLALIKERGGIAVVQDPKEADYPGMPESALRNVAVDHVLPLAGIGSLLADLARNGSNGGKGVLTPPAGDPEGVDPGDIETGLQEAWLYSGAPSGLTCPECAGALWEMTNGEGPLHFRCRTGHAYSPESLLAKQNGSLEAALWAAVRSLEENAALTRRLEKRFGTMGSELSRDRFRSRAEATERHAALLREILFEEVGSKTE
jgi:two-component system chemotaxis response regulator CheB